MLLVCYLIRLLTSKFRKCFSLRFRAASIVEAPPVNTPAVDEPAPNAVEDEAALHAEADALLVELASSQQDILELMQRQAAKGAELESLKEALVGEVRRRQQFQSFIASYCKQLLSVWGMAGLHLCW